MIIDQQLHGYRNGHELLSGTIRLPARDQDLIDRLSDIAGPLTPGEKFAPYLTCYPLPSGTHYVIARTWQDLSAPRAGCVRTRSLIVTMSDWIGLADPAALAQAATEAGPSNPGRQLMVEPSMSAPLPPVDGPGVELLEALFLEDSVPVAVFGAPSPELLAIRFLTAIWPSMRRHFTVSTFCNSPRSISKKSFDLVFAPVAARSRFSDWKGRRIDGTRSTSSRHPWSAQIENEVLRTPRPSLLGLDVFGEMAGDNQGSREALRLSLLWNDLASKIDAEPHAALGLLDIANTRPTRRAELVERLAPALASAAKEAASRMPPAEAWRFLQVLIGKLGHTRWQLSLARSVRFSTAALAGRAPLDAVEAIPRLLEENGGDFLIVGLASGLASAKPFYPVSVALGSLTPSELLRVTLGAQELSATVFREDTNLYASLAKAIEHAPYDERTEAFRRFMPHISQSRHAPVLKALILNAPAEVIEIVTNQVAANTAFDQSDLNDVLVLAARHAGTIQALREMVASAPRSDLAFSMLRQLLSPTSADVDWILGALPVSDPRQSILLLDVLKVASDDQLRSVIAREGMLEHIMQTLGDTPPNNDLLARIADTVHLPIDQILPLIMRILPTASNKCSGPLAARTLSQLIDRPIKLDRDIVITTLLNHSGRAVDAIRVVRAGLATNVPSDLASSNLIHFDSAPTETRSAFLQIPQTIADAIMTRHVLDLSYQAAEAAGRLLWDSAKINNRGYVRASASLLHFLMHQRGAAASPIVAAVFPSVYRELQQDNIPDFLSLVFIFMDWDRCKIARRDLANALVSSQWRPRDIAIAAARAGDLDRILRTIAKRPRGQAAVASIENDIKSIAEPWRSQVQKAIRDIRKGDSLAAKLPFDI